MACDTHKELPVVTASNAELEVDIEPFRTLAAHPLGMSAHIVFEAWDAEAPATLSRMVINDVIRGRIGFDGLLLSDDIDMEALDGTIPEAIAALGGPLAEKSAARLDRVHAAMRAPQDGPETAELLAKRDALLALAEEPAA